MVFTVGFLRATAGSALAETAPVPLHARGPGPRGRPGGGPSSRFIDRWRSWVGLAAFAATTFMLSMFNSNLVNHAAFEGVISVALAYGGIAQMIAGIWEFRTGNTFGAVALTSYGAFLALVLLPRHDGAEGGPLAIGDSALAGGTATTNGKLELGGYLGVGIVTAIAARYAAIAAVLASPFGRDVLPVFPLNR